VYIGRPDGSDTRELSGFSHSDVIPQCMIQQPIVWSPDSTKLAFSPNDGEIAVFDAATGRAIDRFAATSASWSRDSLHMAVTVNAEVPLGRLIYHDACSVAIRDVVAQTSRVIAEGWSPVWSPDGEAIAFGRLGELYVINSDGSEARRLGGYGDLPAPTATFARDHPPSLFPQWLADSNHIAVTIDARLWTIDVATGRFRIVAGGGYLVASSADGEWLLYSSEDPLPEATPTIYGNTPTETVIYVVPANGSLPPQRVTEGYPVSWR